jgi:putative thioredoxin
MPNCLSYGTGDIEQVVQSELVLIEFWTSWCLYSRLLLPKLSLISERYRGRVHVARVDAGTELDFANRLGVEYIPALVLLLKGEVAGKWYGDLPVRAIMEALDAHV